MSNEPATEPFPDGAMRMPFIALFRLSGVGNVERGIRGRFDVDARLRKVVDRTVFDVERFAGEEPDSIEPGTEPLDGQAA